MREFLLDAHKTHINNLPTHNLEHRLSFHKSVLDKVNSGTLINVDKEYHEYMVDFYSKILSERILLENAQ